MRKRNPKKHLKRNVVIIVFLVFVLFLIIMYLMQIRKYQNVFCEDTIINGKDCSSLTIQEAEELIQKEEQQYVLNIFFKNDEVECISGTDIGLEIDNLNEKLTDIKKRQRKDLLLKGGVYTFDNITYNKKKLKNQLLSKRQLSLDFMKKMTEVEYVFNSSSKRFEVDVKNVYYLDLENVLEKVEKALEEKNETVYMKELYVYPEEDETVKKMNRFINSEITYKLPANKEYVLDATTLYTWLVKDDEGIYFKDEEIWNEKLEDFVTNKLSKMSNTVGKEREFKPTGKDNTISVSGGNYGYQLDIQEEIKRLKEELNTQTIITREPCYKFREISNDGLGKSYVEIDLTRQKVWVYLDGKIAVETDCVTGCINKGHETPTGICTLTYKEKNRVLRGRRLPNGNYEYQSHVNYWMPFNGGIGLHDATWRSSFGGDIYINSGSHGCINLPLQKAEKIYQIIDKNMPIIVYKS